MKTKNKIMLFLGALLALAVGIISILSGSAEVQSKEQRQRSKERLKKRKELNEKRTVEDLAVENDSDLEEFL